MRGHAPLCLFSPICTLKSAISLSLCACLFSVVSCLCLCFPFQQSAFCLPPFLTSQSTFCNFPMSVVCSLLSVFWIPHSESRVTNPEHRNCLDSPFPRIYMQFLKKQGAGYSLLNQISARRLFFRHHNSSGKENNRVV